MELIVYCIHNVQLMFCLFGHILFCACKRACLCRMCVCVLEMPMEHKNQHPIRSGAQKFKSDFGLNRINPAKNPKENFFLKKNKKNIFLCFFDLIQIFVLRIGSAEIQSFWVGFRIHLHIRIARGHLQCVCVCVLASVDLLNKTGKKSVI